MPASLNNQQANTTATGTALPAFNTALFATSSTNAFAYHIRTFSTTFPNIRQDAINEWDPSVLKQFNVHGEDLPAASLRVLQHAEPPEFRRPGTLSATSSAFGVITAVANRPRTIQLGARFVF